MNILIDIGHPGHVHYFKNLFFNLQSKGHDFLFIARNREVIKSLLAHYNIPFISRGKGKDSVIGKITYMFYADFLLFFNSLKFRPELFLSFSSPYAAQVSKLLGVPHIVLNDTEHTDSTHEKFTYPFSDSIITPSSYQNELGVKHIKLNCVIESLYLHPDYYQPKSTIYSLLGLEKDDEYVILRFVSWNAFHDVNQKGLSLNKKREIINLLKSRFHIFISAEREIEDEFKCYQINIPPERMHDALAYASLFVGESGTMASESALLGTPVVYINSLPLMCYFNAINIEFSDIKKITKLKVKNMTSEFINPTNFMSWFIENYPQSHQIMKENPDYQYNFK